MSQTVPLLQLALPGVWTQVPLADSVRTHLVVDLLQESGAGVEEVESLRVLLHELLAAGGDQLYLRQEVAAPTVLITAWPVATGDLREAIGVETTELPREDGYLVLRRQSPRTYWISHPVSHRVLSLTVQVYGAEVSDVYDLLATTVSWEDGVRA